MFSMLTLVSIHTPTWGVTPRFADVLVACDVSIHTPTRGVTYANANNASSNSFQSTLPHGE